MQADKIVNPVTQHVARLQQRILDSAKVGDTDETHRLLAKWEEVRNLEILVGKRIRQDAASLIEPELALPQVDFLIAAAEETFRISARYSLEHDLDEGRRQSRNEEIRYGINSTVNRMAKFTDYVPHIFKQVAARIANGQIDERTVALAISLEPRIGAPQTLDAPALLFKRLQESLPHGRMDMEASIWGLTREAAIREHKDLELKVAAYQGTIGALIRAGHPEPGETPPGHDELLNLRAEARASKAMQTPYRARLATVRGIIGKPAGP